MFSQGEDSHLELPRRQPRWSFPLATLPTFKCTVQCRQHRATFWCNQKNGENKFQLSTFYFHQHRTSLKQSPNQLTSHHQAISVPGCELQRKEAKWRRKGETFQTEQVCFYFILLNREVHSKTNKTKCK